MEVEASNFGVSNSACPQQIAPDQRPAWSFEHVSREPASIRGGGCISATLCDSDQPTETEREGAPLAVKPETQPEEGSSSSAALQGEDDEKTSHASWSGWAELENDPEIFTILLQEWGMRNFVVNEVYEIPDLLEIDPSSIFGLIFLSPYVPVEESQGDTPTQTANAAVAPPWFANQISKFSCGTVALMNVLMNVADADIDLSEALSDFKQATSDMNAKNRGVALDNHAQFRDIHNSFSTKLDQYIVDVMLKEEANKAKQKAQAQTRKPTKKRKRTTFTKRRTYKQAFEEEEENGFHFVAYISAHGNVWKLDGTRAEPGHVGAIETGQTWLNVTVQDILPLLQEALSANQQCTMMSVTKLDGAPITSAEERIRKQDDWAPLIETLIRIHAERGDLNQMLGDSP